MKYTKEQFDQVVLNHIRRYENRIRVAESRPALINLAECQALLSLWKSVQAKGFGADFTAVEYSEIEDAYDSGEFDDEA